MSTTDGILGGNWAPSAFALFMLQVVLIVILSRLIGVILKFFKQPAVVAEMLAGIIIGPTVLGRVPHFSATVFPDTSIITVISSFALVFFLFIIGLELDPAKIMADVRMSSFISIVGILVPLTTSFLMANFLHSQPDYSNTSFINLALFLTCTLGMSALPVLARILSERRMLSTRLGSISMSVAAVDDVIGWCLLAVTLTVVRSSASTSAGGENLGILWTVLLIVGELLVMAFVVRPFLKWLVKRDAGHTHLSADTFLYLSMVVVASAYVCEVIGLSALIGGFQVGLLIPRNSNLSHHISEKIEYFVVCILMPLYFAASGLKTQFGLINDAASVGFTVLVIAVATCSKVLGIMIPCCVLGVPCRMGGVIAVLMSCKGLIALIIVNYGLQYAIITPKFFAILVLMVLLTTVMTVPLVMCVDPPSRAAASGAEVAAWERRVADAAEAAALAAADRAAAAAAARRAAVEVKAAAAETRLLLPDSAHSAAASVPAGRSGGDGAGVAEVAATGPAACAAEAEPIAGAASLPVIPLAQQGQQGATAAAAAAPSARPRAGTLAASSLELVRSVARGIRSRGMTLAAALGLPGAARGGVEEDEAAALRLDDAGVARLAASDSAAAAAGGHVGGTSGGLFGPVDAAAETEALLAQQPRLPPFSLLLTVLEPTMASPLVTVANLFAPLMPGTALAPATFTNCGIGGGAAAASDFAQRRSRVGSTTNGGHELSASAASSSAAAATAAAAAAAASLRPAAHLLPTPHGLAALHQTSTALSQRVTYVSVPAGSTAVQVGTAATGSAAAAAAATTAGHGHGPTLSGAAASRALLSGVAEVRLTLAWVLAGSVEMPSSYMNSTSSVADIRDASLLAALGRCRLADRMAVSCFPTARPLADACDEAANRRCALMICTHRILRETVSEHPASREELGALLGLAAREPRPCFTAVFFDFGLHRLAIQRVAVAVDAGRCGSAEAALSFVRKVDPQVEATLLCTGFPASVPPAAAASEEEGAEEVAAAAFGAAYAAATAPPPSPAALSGAAAGHRLPSAAAFRSTGSIISRSAPTGGGGGSGRLPTVGCDDDDDADDVSSVAVASPSSVVAAGFTPTPVADADGSVGGEGASSSRSLSFRRLHDSVSHGCAPTASSLSVLAPVAEVPPMPTLRTFAQMLQAASPGEIEGYRRAVEEAAVAEGGGGGGVGADAAPAAKSAAARRTRGRNSSARRLAGGGRRASSSSLSDGGNSTGSDGTDLCAPAFSAAAPSDDDEDDDEAAVVAIPGRSREQSEATASLSSPATTAAVVAETAAAAAAVSAAGTPSTRGARADSAASGFGRQPQQQRGHGPSSSRTAAEASSASSSAPPEGMVLVSAADAAAAGLLHGTAAAAAAAATIPGSPRPSFPSSTPGSPTPRLLRAASAAAAALMHRDRSLTGDAAPHPAAATPLLLTAAAAGAAALPPLLHLLPQPQFGGLPHHADGSGHHHHGGSSGHAGSIEVGGGLGGLGLLVLPEGFSVPARPLLAFLSASAELHESPPPPPPLPLLPQAAAVAADGGVEAAPLSHIHAPPANDAAAGVAAAAWPLGRPNTFEVVPLPLLPAAAAAHRLGHHSLHHHQHSHVPAHFHAAAAAAAGSARSLSDFAASSVSVSVMDAAAPASASSALFGGGGGGSSNASGVPAPVALDRLLRGAMHVAPYHLVVLGADVRDYAADGRLAAPATGGVAAAAAAGDAASTATAGQHGSQSSGAAFLAANIPDVPHLHLPTLAQQPLPQQAQSASHPLPLASGTAAGAAAGSTAPPSSLGGAASEAALQSMIAHLVDCMLPCAASRTSALVVFPPTRDYEAAARRARAAL